jgi:hypothetical protein
VPNSLMAIRITRNCGSRWPDRDSLKPTQHQQAPANFCQENLIITSIEPRKAHLLEGWFGCGSLW